MAVNRSSEPMRTACGRPAEHQVHLVDAEPWRAGHGQHAHRASDLPEAAHPHVHAALLDAAHGLVDACRDRGARAEQATRAAGRERVLGS